MNIVNFSFDYGQKLTSEQLAAVMQITGKQEKDIVDGKAATEVDGIVLHQCGWGEHHGDIYALLNLGIPLKIREQVDLNISSYHRLLQFVQGINSKLAKIDAFIEDQGSVNSQQFNNKVNVHVSNGALMSVTETKVEEDCCTDHLQGELNDGWRILAVCVQPNQRRPDYILGRVKL